MHSVWLSWSSGKDSAYTLKMLQHSEEYKVTGLLTTVTDTFQRVSMHATRLELLQWQANVLHLPLHVINIPYPCNNEIYETKMQAAIQYAKEQGIYHMAFGDLFLEDVRSYREKQLHNTGIQPIFPLWGIDTALLSQQMINDGFKAKITCIDPKKLPPEFAGRDYDHDFLNDLPSDVDPCGENGEFHSFVYDGPIFNDSLNVDVGEIQHRDGFVFADITTLHRLNDTVAQ